VPACRSTRLPDNIETPRAPVSRGSTVQAWNTSRGIGGSAPLGTLENAVYALQQGMTGLDTSQAVRRAPGQNTALLRQREERTTAASCLPSPAIVTLQAATRGAMRGNQARSSRRQLGAESVIANR
jgi:hypothetical protein